jgi:cytochrome c biogenesis protein CcmG, thiol:disulfide interchange protein DsbE
VLPAVLILGLFGWKLVSQSPAGGQPGVNSVGQATQFKPRPVPNVALRTWEGDTFRLAAMPGQLLVLNFWGSWCLPCRQEAPDLEAAWRRAQTRGVVFIGINEWDAESDARAFMREFGVSYVNAPDPTGQLAVELGVTGIPETYLVDRTGQVVRRWIGPIGQQRLLEMIAEVDSSASTCCGLSTQPIAT